MSDPHPLTLPALSAALKRRLRPLVLVAAAPSADAALGARNGGAGVVDLLRTQSLVQGLNVPVRMGDGVARVNELELRFVAAGAAAPAKPEAADARCREAMSEAAAAAAVVVAAGGPLSDPSLSSSSLAWPRFAPDSTGGGVEAADPGIGAGGAKGALAATVATTTALAPAAAAAAAAVLPAPWFRAYVSEFDRLLAFCPQEALDLPVACVYVLPADVRDPVGHAEALLRGQPPLPAASSSASAATAATTPTPSASSFSSPSTSSTWCPTAAAIRQLLRDPAFPRHYVLLDDAAAEAKEARDAAALGGGSAAGDAARQARQARVRDNAASLRHRFGAPNVTVLRVNSRWAEAEAEAAAGTGGGVPAPTTTTPRGLGPEAFLAVRPPRLPPGSASASPGAPGAVACGCAGELYAEEGAGGGGGGATTATATATASPPHHHHQLGAALSAGDVSAARSVVAAIAAGTLLPRLEERLTRLDAAVSASRRGLGNRLRRFLKAGGGGGGGSESDAAQQQQQQHQQQSQQQPQAYAWDSPEWQMRQLGDLLSLLRCWAPAAAAYRLASADYLAAGQHAWYASAQEALAVCCLMASAVASQQQQQSGGGSVAFSGAGGGGFFSSANGSTTPTADGAAPSTPGSSVAGSVHGGSIIGGAGGLTAGQQQQQQQNPLAAALAQASAAASPAAGDPARYFARAFEHYARAAAIAAAASTVPQDPAAAPALPPAARLCRMLATRSMLRCAAWHEAQGRPALAAAALMRAHFDDENARAALLLERAAGLLLASPSSFLASSSSLALSSSSRGGGAAGAAAGVAPLPPPPPPRPVPQRRRFAFHTVLAGLRFQAARQPGLAAACYARAQGVYEGAGWRFIDEHFHDALARRAAQAQAEAEGAGAAAVGGAANAAAASSSSVSAPSCCWAAADALAQAAALLECGHRPPAAQQARVEAFEAAAARWAAVSAAAGGGGGGGGGAAALPSSSSSPSVGPSQAVAAVATLSAAELDDEALARAFYSLLAAPNLVEGGGDDAAAAAASPDNAAAAAAGRTPPLPTPEALAAATAPLRRLAVLSRLSRASGLPIVEGLPVPRVSLGGGWAAADNQGGVGGGGAPSSSSCWPPPGEGWTRCSGVRCTADGPAARAVPEGDWSRLELCAAAAAAAASAVSSEAKEQAPPSLALAGGAALLAAGAAAAKRPPAVPAVAAWRGAPFAVVAAGEEVGVDVSFANPLAVRLTLTHVRLLCEFSPSAGGEATTTTTTTTTTEAAVSPRSPHPTEVDVPSVVELALHPGERLTQRLVARPSAAAAGGWLKVVGVAWVVGGAAEGRALLLPPAEAAGAGAAAAAAVSSSSSSSSSRRSKRAGEPPPESRRLLFRVAPGMPRLETRLSTWVGEGATVAAGEASSPAAAPSLPLPPTVYAGEVLRATLTVRNVGSCPARNVALAYEAALAEEVDEDDGGRRVSLAAGGGGGGGGDGVSAAAANDGTAPPPLALVLARRQPGPSCSSVSADPDAAAADALAALRLAEQGAGEEPVPDPLAAAVAADAERGRGGDTNTPPPPPPPPPSLPQEAAALLARVAASGGQASNALLLLPRTATLAGLAAAAAAAPSQSPPAPPLVLPLLRPGESASATLWVLASRSGAASVRVAWYCEPEPPAAAAAGELPCRLSRCAWPLTALPLLRAAAVESRLLSSSSSSVAVRLDVEAARVGARPLVTGLGVLPPLAKEEEGAPLLSSSSSRRWAVAAPAEGEATPLPSSLLPLALPLEPGQQAAVAARLVPLSTGSDTTTPLPPCPLDSRVLRELLRAQRLQGQRWLRGSGRGAASGPTAPATAVDLALCWRLSAGDADDGAASLSPSTSSSSPSRAGLLLLPDALAPLRERPIQLSVAAAAAPGAAAPGAAAPSSSANATTAVIPHDFSASPLCVVPLILRVANSGDRACAVEVLLGDAGDASSAASAARAAAGTAWHVMNPASQQPPQQPQAPLVQAGLPPAPEVAWVGASRVAVAGGGAGLAAPPVLAPGAVAEVPLAVAAMRAGHHALPDYRVEWRPVGAGADEGGEEATAAAAAGRGGVMVGPALTLAMGPPPAPAR